MIRYTVLTGRAEEVRPALGRIIGRPLAKLAFRESFLVVETHARTVEVTVLRHTGNATVVVRTEEHD